MEGYIESKFLSAVDNNLKPKRYKSVNNISQNIANFFKKKIKLSSAFDHKGSKQFLLSKKEALQQIIIDDNDSSSNNDSDTKSDSNKQKKYLKYRHPKTFITNNANICAKGSNNLYKYSKIDNLRKKLQKMSKNKDNNIKTLINKELNMHKRSINKFFSSQELRMFKDKEIKKIKPIKKINKDLENKKEIKINKFPFVESDNSIDSSLFNIVSQMQ